MQRPATDDFSEGASRCPSSYSTPAFPLQSPSSSVPFPPFHLALPLQHPHLPTSIAASPRLDFYFRFHLSFHFHFAFLSPSDNISFRFLLSRHFTHPLLSARFLKFHQPNQAKISPAPPPSPPSLLSTPTHQPPRPPSTSPHVVGGSSSWSRNDALSWAAERQIPRRLSSSQWRCNHGSHPKQPKHEL